MGMTDKKEKENTSIDLDLVINILIEEHIVDEITAIELKKQQPIMNTQELLAGLALYGVVLKQKTQKEVSILYDIVSKEGIQAGDYKTIKVKTASRIRSLIGKWNPPSTGQMKIGEVLEDIFLKISESIQGETYYYTGKGKGGKLHGKYVYKLIICKNISVFVDLNRKKSYHIIGRSDQ